MTTIAWDEQTVAWDSLITVGDEKYISPDSQKVVAKDGVIFMVAGHAGMLNKSLIPWWKKGHKEEDAPGGEWDMAVITHEGVFLYSSENPGQEVVAPKVFAMGSGSMAARGALACSAGPVGAVQVATTIDKSSGGPVNSLRIADNVRAPIKRRAARRR